MNKAPDGVLFLMSILAGVLVGIAASVGAWAQMVAITIVFIGFFINRAAKIIECAIERSNRDQTK